MYTGDRERQIRRLRRETARFSSTSGIAPDLSRQQSSSGYGGGGGYFDIPDEPMGRGERSKKKRRFRSLSPLGGRSGTPGGGGRGTPDTGAGAGYGGKGKLGVAPIALSGVRRFGPSEMDRLGQG
ncbi:hypothetical protein ACJ72_01303 [Emergomyces africanus]|uniref:Uncharacterized protein n=1 Tax=Emergomyces africanus TaxID=1955775 RepID=A0A1B7P5Q4_9EURO|nr:hypothetical protein ACJ72_01303 [Emergomyces africanus]